MRVPCTAPVGQGVANSDSDSDVDLYPGDRPLGPPTPLPDGVRLRAQYHALQAMAAKLDSGYGTEVDAYLFEQSLAEYNELFERVKETRALPAPAKTQ